MSTPHLLILGGTGEAVALARAVIAEFGDGMRLTTALAGRTRRPGPIPGQVRIGGFGGPAALAEYMNANAVSRAVDATHPFATLISATARLACETAGVPRLVLQRPPWRRHVLDRWIEVDTIEAAAAIVGRVGRQAWLTIGARALQAFAGVDGVHFLVRLVDPPRAPLPLRSGDVVLGRGPFALAEELHLLRRHAIDVLVCKASGGDATEAKIVAARELGLPVVMIRRPKPEPGPYVDTIAAALDWVAGRQPFPEAKRVS